MNDDDKSPIVIVFLIIVVDIIKVIEIFKNPNAISIVEFLGQYIRNGFFYISSILGGICLTAGIVHAIKKKKWTKESTEYVLLTIFIIVSSAITIYSAKS